jgi:serine/threonine protein kinase/tetratricopeptide (TPR) repeat protein
MLGTTLGPYRIDRELGAGGMGKVYAAVLEGRSPGLAEGTPVALKVVHPHLLKTPGFFKRFLREAEIGRSVLHENVVRTFDCDALGGQMYLVMEYVEGQTLRELADEVERVPEELCRHIGREVAKGLAAIHAAGAIHRDMKPENVLITREHVVKVMDLGLARLSAEALRLSQTGTFVGTLHYAAPECFSGDGQDVDQRADLHALGLILYELACGVNPYAGDGVAQVLKKVVHDPPQRLGERNPQLSPFYEEVVHILLAKQPGERFTTADELLRVLEDGEASAWWRTKSTAIRAVTHQPLRRIRIPRETAVYGREQDIARLRGLYEKAKAGEGQVVVLEGEAGIGKSRVVDEFIGRLQRDGEDLNFLFGSFPPNGAATAAGAFSAAFQEQFGEAGSARYLAQTPLLVPAFDALLRGDATPGGVEPLTKDSLPTCFVQAVRGLAAERVTVVLIDDLHFATEGARALFTALALALPGHRILLIGTTRRGIDEKWLSNLTRLPQTSPLVLHRLGPKDVAALLLDSLRSEALAAQLGERIALKTDGNPYFVFEIIRSLRDGQYLTQANDGTWTTKRAIDEIQIPSSVLDLVGARVADLSADERALLDVAACWGFEFDPGLVAEVLGLARLPVLRAFGQVERQHRLVRSSGRHYAFDHHQVQEALYSSINEQLREEYHAALAQAMEARAQAQGKAPEALDGALCVDLCEHFLRGAQGERALRYLEAAHDHLKRRYLNEAAVRLGERALGMPGMLLGASRARVLLRLARVLDLIGRRSRQEECVREAEALAVAAGADEVRGQAALALATVCNRTARVAEAEGPCHRAIEIARSRGDRRAEAEATTVLGSVCWAQGRFSEAREQHQAALDVFRAMGDLAGEGRAAADLANVLSSQGDYAASREQGERALAISRELGDRAREAMVMGNLGNLHWRQGRLRETLEHYEQALAIHREIGSRAGEAVILVNLGPLFYMLGMRDRVRGSLLASLAICREIGTRYPEGYVLRDLGRLADEEDDPAQALRFLEESLTLRRRIGHADGVADSLLEMARVRRRSGDAEGARVAVDEALPWLREQGGPAKVAEALALRACLPGGDVQAALAVLAEAGPNGVSAEVRWLLWQATGDREHLVEARRLMEVYLSQAGPEARTSVVRDVRLYRELSAALEAAGL